ncbi:hypothetical protein MSAN_00860500 [Mycena sanguinolenta]|uniref:Uncharacterized protein n=1 Tax=Mycena sanguinolenta TaxID=230812 RepID=A0A8H6YVP3_9AGAR|nr:hypothetical protein MSAN_00860500 [Mycena sanguinolenta]
MSSKTLTFYTTTRRASKRLNDPVQIVLTVSLDPDKPVMYRSSKEPYDTRTMETQLPIAWQVLQFDIPNSLQHVSVDYTEEFGVTETLTEIRGVYSPGLCSLGVDTGKLVKYSGKAWSSDTLYSPGPPLKHFAIQNNAGNTAEIALCIYSTREQDAQQPYIPVVLLGPLNDGCELLCTTPIFLQAYLTTSYRRGQRLPMSVVENSFLFKDSAGKAQPKLMSDLKRCCTFHVYSLPNGETTVEMTLNRD